MTILQPLPEAPQTGFWERLSEFGPAPALRTDSGDLTYVELAARVADLRRRLGATRRLVVLAARNDVDTVVGYLACLAGGHPVLLAGPDRAEALVAAYDADVLLDGSLQELRPGTAHTLHPDLAQLISTSGSTGSPKLVRLSAVGVAANADAIASYLALRGTDVGVTTLPLHYCYGLSVLTSHLAVGASVLLTDRSVLDEELWVRMREARVSNVPGVPHTFELLERRGFDPEALPSLRALTQAGGRMAPERVRRFAELGQRSGFDLFVMYGATEATARMAYLPPERAIDHPEAVGVALPGGRFELKDVDVDGVGELVFFGDNVMLGYATSTEDLALGRVADRLDTGDLARIGDHGLVEIVGRKGRFAKVFGLRLDLEQIERTLSAQGVAAFAADAGDRVVIGVDASASPVDGNVVRRLVDLPCAAVEVVALPGVPRLASGKVDYAEIAAFGARGAPPAVAVDLASVYAEVLGRSSVDPGCSFVDLGGDSLSYVEMSLRLEAALGGLPPDWHTRPIRELVSTERKTPGRLVETNVLLRALAIVLIVGSHADLFTVMGGAHVLLGVAGFNFARFQLTGRPRLERFGRTLRSVARIAVPSVLWLAFADWLSSEYDWPNVLLLNGVLGPRAWSDAWHYWFIEAIVWTTMAMALLLVIPAADRLERRHPFLFPVGLALAALLTRYDVVRFFDGDFIHRGHVVFWLFALGWAAARASTAAQRLLVSAILVVTVYGFFDGAPNQEHLVTQHGREAVIVVGLLFLVWIPTLRLPAVVARVSGVLAASSLFTYLCHWQIYPRWEDSAPWLATVLSLLGGIVLWRAWTWVAFVTPHAAGSISRGLVAGLEEIRDNRRWLSHRRYSDSDEGIAPAQGAH